MSKTGKWYIIVCVAIYLKHIFVKEHSLYFRRIGEKSDPYLNDVEVQFGLPNPRGPKLYYLLKNC